MSEKKKSAGVLYTSSVSGGGEEVRNLTVFTLLVFVCCVVIFPIHCDLSDFL